MLKTLLDKFSVSSTIEDIARRLISDVFTTKVNRTSYHHRVIAIAVLAIAIYKRDNFSSLPYIDQLSKN